MTSVRFALACTGVLLLGHPAARAAPPVTAFTNFARYETLQISPNGSHLAMTRRFDAQENITVVRFPELAIASSSHFGKMIGISSLRWANETRLLIQPERRFGGLIDYKAPTGEILGIDYDGRNSGILFGYMAGEGRSAIKAGAKQSTYAAARVIDRLPDDPDHVLIETMRYGIPGISNMAYRLHVRSGELDAVASAPLPDGRFVTNAQHQVALSYGAAEDGKFKVYRLNGGAGTWTLVDEMSALGGTLMPLAATGTEGEYQALDDHSDPVQGVVAWNAHTGERRTLFRHARSDVYPVGTDPKGFVWLYGYDEHFPMYWYPDPRHPLAVVHRAMVAQYPDSNILFTSQTDDMSLAVARISSPTQPALFLVVDVKSRKPLLQLESRPDLPSRELSPVEPVKLRARDGVSIDGFLTTPRGGSRRKLPMVVLVHGGPHGIYDSYDFDWEAQLLASAGYAVLQVNYRGSGGHGRDFEASGYGKWGAQMQDDVTDATRWAIQDGVADPQRICIMGGSYGAFSALAGVSREPDLYRCAVGIAGVYDLQLMHEKGDIPDTANGRRYLRMAVGTDAEDMKRRSPASNARQITAAVMLVHGRDDERAPYEQATRMRAALQAAGREPEWIVVPREAHGFFNEANRAKVYGQVLAFLARHTAPR